MFIRFDTIHERVRQNKKKKAYPKNIFSRKSILEAMALD